MTDACFEEFTSHQRHSISTTDTMGELCVGDYFTTMATSGTSEALEGFLSIEAPETPDRMKQVARKELGETEELKEKCLKAIKILIKGLWNTGICTDDETVTTFMLVISYAAEKESSQVTGLVCLCDNKNIPVSHMPYLPRHIFFIHSFLFKCLPVRYKEMHMINNNFLVKLCLQILRRVFPKKIMDRIVVHGDTREAFFQNLPRCIIPSDYGGTLGPLNNDHLIDALIDYLQKMKDELQYFIQGDPSKE